MNKNKGYANLRKGRYSEIGFHYHIVISTKDRRSIFRDFTLARSIITCLKESDDSNFTDTLSFVIMPDHIHWLFILKYESVSKCVQRVKAQFSRQSKLKIWQQGFYDHGIRNNESLLDTSRYIAANPLRAGLVDHIGMYPHWDSAWL